MVAATNSACQAVCNATLSIYGGDIYIGIMTIIMAFPLFFLKIFSPEQKLIITGKIPMMIYFMGFFMMSLQFSAQTTFTSLGKAKRDIFFFIFRKIIIVVPLTILLPQTKDLAVMGVFLSEPISNFLGGIASFTTMYITVYKKLK